MFMPRSGVVLEMVAAAIMEAGGSIRDVIRARLEAVWCVSSARYEREWTARIGRKTHINRVESDAQRTAANGNT